MITNFQKGDPVWTIYDPLKGYLKLPEYDYIKEVNHHSNSAVLQSHNYLDDPNQDHWTNDFYGNCISAEYLFVGYESAQKSLRHVYSKQLCDLENKASRVRDILINLQEIE